MPVLDGIEATRLICADPTLRDTRVLVLTTFDLDEYVYAALRAVIAEFAARPDPQAPPVQLADLTEGENEILRLVATGLTDADIAQRLVISPLTAKTHVGRILAKLNCHDRAQLVTLAYESGLITPGQQQATMANDPPTMANDPP